MDSRRLFSRLLQVPYGYSYLLAPVLRPKLHPYRVVTLRTIHKSTSIRSSSDSLPRIAQPSLWQIIIPKPLRHPVNTFRAIFRRPGSSDEPNSAGAFIILGLLVGSQAIQILLLKNEKAAFTRKTEARIQSFKDVIEKVQAGMDVDVEGALGTGDPEKEKEWEEALKEIENKGNMIGSEDGQSKLTKFEGLDESEGKREKGSERLTNTETEEKGKKVIGFY